MTVRDFTTVDHVNLLVLFALCPFYCRVVIYVYQGKRRHFAIQK